MLLGFINNQKENYFVVSLDHICTIIKPAWQNPNLTSVPAKEVSQVAHVAGQGKINSVRLPKMQFNMIITYIAIAVGY